MPTDKSWSSVRGKLKKNPKFRSAYEEQSPEFQRVRSIIDARLRS